MAENDDKNNPLLRGVPDVSRGILKHLIAPSGQILEALRLSPPKLDQQTQTLSQVGAELPVGVLSGAQKAALRKKYKALPSNMLRGTATVLRSITALKLVPVTPERIETTAAQMHDYTALRDQAARGAELTGKLRRLVGTYAAYMIDAATRYVVETIQDPNTTPADRELLRQKGALLLRTRDDVISAQVEGRSDARARAEADAAEAERLRKEALIQDVTAAVKNGWALDRDSLNLAARYYEELHGGEKTAAKGDGERRGGRRGSK